MTNIKNQINTKFKEFKYQTGTHLLLPAYVNQEGMLSLFEFLILRKLSEGLLWRDLFIQRIPMESFVYCIL